MGACTAGSSRGGFSQGGVTATARKNVQRTADQGLSANKHRELRLCAVTCGKECVIVAPSNMDIIIIGCFLLLFTIGGVVQKVPPLAVSDAPLPPSPDLTRTSLATISFEFKPRSSSASAADPPLVALCVCRVCVCVWRASCEFRPM